MGKKSKTKQVTKSKDKSKSTNSVVYPEWFSSTQQDLAATAQKNAHTPTAGYDGQLVADFSPDQQAAYQFLRNYVPESMLQEALGGAKAYADAPAQQIDPRYMNAEAQNIGVERIVDQDGRLGSLADYFNPFVQYNLNPALDAIRGQGDTVRKRTNMLASGAGRAFGDARHGILESENEANTQGALGDASYRAFKDAWDNSMQLRRGDQDLMYRSDLANAGFAEGALDRIFKGSQAQGAFNETALGRKLQGSQAMQAASAADQQQQLQLLQQKLAAGGQQTAHEQSKLAADYGEFLRKYSGDQDKLKMYAAVVNSMNPEKTVKGKSSSSGTTTQTTTQPDNSWQQLAGSLLGAAMAPMTGGASLLPALGGAVGGLASTGMLPGGAANYGSAMMGGTGGWTTV